MRKYLVTLASVALSLGLVFAISGVASAKNGGKHGGEGYGYGHGPTAVVATGTTSCNIEGKLTINSNGIVKISGNITPAHGPGNVTPKHESGNKHGSGNKPPKGGSGNKHGSGNKPPKGGSGNKPGSGNKQPKGGQACTSTGGTKLKTGHFSTSLMSTTPTTTLACPPVGPLPDVSGGTITWSPPPKVAASVGVALTGGTISDVTVGSKQYLEIMYTGGSVASGSFTGASGVSLTAWSNEPVSAKNSGCEHHSHPITFHGTLTL